MKPGEEDTKAHELVIIRRRSGGEEGGHHGGVWKIAYADFMTAMMAFFLVMWLINSTDQKVLTQVANYFNPMRLTDKHAALARGSTRRERRAGQGGQAKPDRRSEGKGQRQSRQPKEHAKAGQGQDEHAARRGQGAARRGKRTGQGAVSPSRRCSAIPTACWRESRRGRDDRDRPEEPLPIAAASYRDPFDPAAQRTARPEQAHQRQGQVRSRRPRRQLTGVGTGSDVANGARGDRYRRSRPRCSSRRHSRPQMSRAPDAKLEAKRQPEARAERRRSASSRPASRR